MGRLLRVNNAILDGEIVCLDAAGHSVFNELLHRRGDPVFYAFDLLWLNGEDLRQLPLIERKQRLRRLIRPMHRTTCFSRSILMVEGLSCSKRFVNQTARALLPSERTAHIHPHALDCG